VTAVRIVVGDITDLEEPADAIVNAANSHLAQGSGVCGAIFAAAGPTRMAEACRPLAPCRTGTAVATPSLALADRGIEHVVHAVGPIWPATGDPADEARADALLADAYRSTMAVAEQLQVRRLAVPALSTGVYGYPPDRAARIAVRTVADHRGDLEAVLLVAFDEGAATTLRAALDALGPDRDEA
jgi:O-acetyl-ADP-ribose deacetylase (regulator of RNase III)